MAFVALMECPVPIIAAAVGKVTRLNPDQSWKRH